MIGLWPLRFFAACQEYIFWIKNPERFVVMYGPADKRESMGFQSYNDALSFAQSKAKDIKISKKVIIIDRMKADKVYQVRPNGRVDIY